MIHNSMDEPTKKPLAFAIPTDAPRIIKVVGVGGGGSNAVHNMYKKGIHNVSFAVCNTDLQAMCNSPIPKKLQLGEKLTEGLGAGNDPAVARQAAEESREEIKKMFDDGTKMAFITAGMGGGTGTGAAPVVAEIARSMGILTVGIVTIPFRFELKTKIKQALRGVIEISKQVDALIVINNQRLIDIYPKMSVDEGFKTVDEVLTTATKSIAEIITTRGGINTDFRDVNKILKNGGVAIMSYGIASGEMRVSRAFHNALHSPLLNNSDIYKAKKILFNIYGNPNSPMLVEEMGEIEAFMQKFTDKNIELIWGYSKDHNLGDGEVKVTVLATGFGMKDIPGMESEVETIKEEKKNLSQQEEERIKQEDEKLDHMVSVLYKPDYKVYIFKGDEMYNEEFIAALDNSPTYKRTAQELERMVATLNEVKPIPENIEDKETVKIEEEEDFTPGVPVYYNDESVKEMDDENN
ncbi:MAG: cell division protein FtsZ [Bacteroidaceae bacterium]|nr:cell division protein FtsZ [Bacteroidaceae bacterium]